MVNQCRYEKCEEMEIDEKREIDDLSEGDHCIVRLSLKIKKNKRK